MNKNDSIFVAGHKGLVGSAIIRCLRKSGFNSILTRTRAELDLTNQQDVRDFFSSESPQYVFLAAARVGGIHANDTYPAEFIYSNLQIQNNVIHSAWKSGVKKLLFLGSSCIYPKTAPQPMKEECLLTGPLEPTNQWYAIAKIAGIKMCQAYRRQYGFNAISAMPTNLYGPNDNYDLYNSHVLPALLRKFHLASLASAGDMLGIAHNENKYGNIPDDILNMLGLTRDGSGFVRSYVSPKVMLWGTGSPKREFLHVDDLAEASVFLMDNYKGCKIVNVGVGVEITIRELAQWVQRIVGFEGEVIWDEGKPNGTTRKLMDISRLHKLGWAAKIDLYEGISLVYKSMREN